MSGAATTDPRTHGIAPRSARRRRAALAVLTALGAAFVAVAPTPTAAPVSATSATCPTPSATFSGAGTPADPYLVTNAAHLAAIAADEARFQYASILQTADIDLSCSATPHTPIGSNVTFSGTYDGGGHTIDNLVIDDPSASNLALFAYTEDATITDLTLSNVSISAWSDSAALIASATSTTVSGVSVVGARINGASYVMAGLIAAARGGWVSDVTISDTTIFGVEYLGGLIGDMYARSQTEPATISNVRISADISSDPNQTPMMGAVGGLIGSLSLSNVVDTIITDVAVTGDITSIGDYTGGIIGYTTVDAGLSLTIDSAYTTGNVTGMTYTGGIIGGASGNGGLTLTNSYSQGSITGDVNGNGKVGGLVGELWMYSGSPAGTATVSASYATGAVTAPNDAGGLVGFFGGGGIANALSSFWDVDTTGLATSAIGTSADGLTSQLMTALDTYATATPPWPIVAAITPTAGAVWGYCAGEYPFLLWDSENVPLSCGPSATSLPVPPPPPVQAVERVSGADRYGTAVALSQHHRTTAATVYLVAGHDFADGLVAGTAAAADDAPLLMVTRDAIPVATLFELQRLAPSDVVIVGGTDSIGDAVEARVRSLGVNVTRIAGADRYATATAVSRRSHQAGAEVVYVATGTGFADALASAPASDRDGAPVLLTRPDELPSVTATELARLRPSLIVVVGGTSVVSERVAQQLAAFAPVSRIAGADRYATSAALARRSHPATAATVVLTTGTAHPDALAGAAFAAAVGAPVMLTRADCVPTSVAAELRRLSPTNVIVVGGANALGAAMATLPTCTD